MTARLRQSLLGIAFILLVIAIVVLSILQFNRAFDSSVPVSVKSPRAGLLLTSGSAVKLRGVTVGHVDSVHATTGGALLDLAIDPGSRHLIPADVGAQIVPPTLFGGKYVDLTPPPTDADGSIQSHAVISASKVTVEFNETFENLVDLLDAAKPEQVNAALTALSKTLDGRGNQLGQLLTKVNTYLGSINPELGTFNGDIATARPVLNTYSNVTPNLLKTARNLTTTSDTVQNNRAAVDAMLLSVTDLSNKSTKFVQQNQHSLTTALDVLQPTAQVLARYSPEFPCFFRGLVDPGLPLAESAIGGKQPGLGVLAQFLPPEPTYTYPKDLPKVAADAGPDCHGLPDISMGTKFKHEAFDVGPDPYASDSPTPGFTLPSLLQLLFGPIKGVTS